jgi:hypothetical protein
MMTKRLREPRSWKSPTRSPSALRTSSRKEARCQIADLVDPLKQPRSRRESGALCVGYTVQFVSDQTADRVAPETARPQGVPHVQSPNKAP